MALSKEKQYLQEMLAKLMILAMFCWGCSRPIYSCGVVPSCSQSMLPHWNAPICSLAVHWSQRVSFHYSLSTINTKEIFTAWVSDCFMWNMECSWPFPCVLVLSFHMACVMGSGHTLFLHLPHLPHLPLPCHWMWWLWWCHSSSFSK